MFMKNKNCNLSTCRYNADGKCTNEGKRKECIEVARKVLCEDDICMRMHDYNSVIAFVNI